MGGVLNRVLGRVRSAESMGLHEVGTSVPAGPHRPNRQPPSPNRSRTPFAPVGTRVPAGPGSVKADMRSGTSSLREMKPDPMSSADRGRSALPDGPWHEVRHAIAARGEARPLPTALPRPLPTADRGRSALPDARGQGGGLNRVLGRVQSTEYRIQMRSGNWCGLLLG